MRGKFFLLFLVLWFLSSGCSLLAILDTNPYDDAPADNRTYYEQKVEEKRQKLLGLSQGEVLSRLGKSEWINKLDNYQMVSKFRENQYVFDGIKKCRMSECGPIVADESWSYNLERRTERYYSQYGFSVFFKNHIVVAVE